MGNKIRFFCAFVLLNSIYLTIKAQVVIGGNVADNSAILELRSSSKGFLIPRLTTAQRDAMPVNALSEGMSIYNTDVNCIEYYTGIVWFNMCKDMAIISKVTCDPNLNSTGVLKVAQSQTNTTKTVYVDVVSPGNYVISAFENGVNFIGSGSFQNKGTNQSVVLNAIGVPLADGVHEYTTDVPEATNCTFSFTTMPGVGELSTGGTAVVSDYYLGTQEGTAIVGIDTKYENLTQKITAVVTKEGTYNIKTAPVNGVTFSGAGTVLKGTQTIVLKASGTPSTLGSYLYATNTSPKNVEFNLDVAVASFSSGGSALVGGYIVTGEGTGYLVAPKVDLTNEPVTYLSDVSTEMNTDAEDEGILPERIKRSIDFVADEIFDINESWSYGASTISREVIANVTKLGSYNIVTNTNNGLTFKAMGRFEKLGANNIMLVCNDLPVQIGTFGFSLKTNPTASFTIVTTKVQPESIIAECKVLSASGKAIQGIKANVTEQILANVTKQGTYNISSDTQNGLTFSAKGVFTQTGFQTIVLVATGIPTQVGTFTYTLNTNHKLVFVFQTIEEVKLPSSNGTAEISSFIEKETRGSAIKGFEVEELSKVIFADVTEDGSYNISTSNNGITFAASGVFDTTGTNAIILKATGIPTNVGTFTYSLNTSPGLSFDVQTTQQVILPSSNGTANVVSYTEKETTGTATQRNSVANLSKKIIADVGKKGTYNISTSSNGITFASSGTFTTTGNQTIILVATGTPTDAGTFTYTLNTTPTLSFPIVINELILPSSNGSAEISSYTEKTTQGTATQRTLVANLSKTIVANVTQKGTYKISASSNGITFASSGTLTSTGNQTITLVATGTPTDAGTFTYTLNTTPNLSFSIVTNELILSSSNGSADIASYTEKDTQGTATQSTTIVSLSKTIVANVTEKGKYNISASNNGITFAASGTFASTGSQTITLLASGTPTNVGTFTYTLNTTPNLSFSIVTNELMLPSSNGSAEISSYTEKDTQGTATQSIIIASLSKTIVASVTQKGKYNISASSNGITFAASGTFASTGNQTITLVASGTPTAEGDVSFKLNTTPTVSFTITVKSLHDASTNGTAIVSNYSLGNVSGSAIAGQAVVSLTQQIIANVTQAGTYKIQVVENGITFTASETFASIGNQKVVLTASGTPTNNGAFVYKLNTTPTVSFTITVDALKQLSTNATAIVKSYKTPVLTGTSTLGEAVSGLSVQITADVSNVGTYDLKAIKNGITFVASGTFAATGNQNITLTAQGTPTSESSFTFTLNTSPTISFEVYTKLKNVSQSKLVLYYPSYIRYNTIKASELLDNPTDYAHDEFVGSFCIISDGVNKPYSTYTGAIPTKNTLVYDDEYAWAGLSWGNSQWNQYSDTGNIGSAVSASSKDYGIAIGGWPSGGDPSDPLRTGGFDRIGASDADLTEFVNNLNSSSVLPFITKKPTSIHIDYEFPVTSNQATYLLNIVKKIKAICQSKYRIDIALGPNNIKHISILDLTELNKYVDVFQVMTYDYIGAWSTQTGHHTGLYPNVPANSSDSNLSADFSIDEQVKYLMSRGIPANKIKIGVALYGRTWAGIDPASFPSLEELSKDTVNPHFTSISEQAIPSDLPGASTFDEYKVIKYKDIITYISPANGWESYFDSKAKAAFAIHRQKGLFLSYDDVNSIREKAKYVKTKGLGGIIVWEAAGAYGTSILKELRAAMNETINKKSTNGSGDVSNYVVGLTTGTATKGVPVSGLSKKVTATVSSIGSYQINTDTQNGITFSVNGIFSQTGDKEITLTASGTPTTSGTFTYTFDTTPSVSFNINVVAPSLIDVSTNGTAVVSNYTLGDTKGAATVGRQILELSKDIIASVTTIGTYNISTTDNGITFAASGTFNTLGNQTITLLAKGTPTNDVVGNYALNTAPNVTFAIDPDAVVKQPSTNETAIVDSYTLVNNNLIANVGKDVKEDGLYQQIIAKVSKAGSYIISTGTVNGVTFQASGTLISGNQTITLTASGSPTVSQTDTFTINTTPSVSFKLQANPAKLDAWEQLLTPEFWNASFPNRAGYSYTGQGYTEDFYSYDNLKKAIKELKKFKIKIFQQGSQQKIIKIDNATGNETEISKTASFVDANSSTIKMVDFGDFVNGPDQKNNKRELAAFLANISKETNGGWDGVGGDRTIWGLTYVYELGHTKENCTFNQYVDTGSTEFPPVTGICYHGRGPIQLSWNYNFGPFSKALYGDKQILLNNPDLVSQSGSIAFQTAVWFWMLPRDAKPSAHEVMQETWSGSSYPNDQMKKKGFLHTNNIINGGYECRESSTEAYNIKPALRSSLYKFYLMKMGLTQSEIDAEDQGDYSTLCYKNISGTIKAMTNY